MFSENVIDSMVVASPPPILDVVGLEHRLRDPERHDEFVLTVDPCVSIYPGSFVAILGPSGCGKTTLLTLLGLLRRPSDLKAIDRFTMTVPGRKQRMAVFDLKETWRRNRQGRIERLRRRHIGFALQSGELLASLNVRENVALPLRLNGVWGRRCRRRVDELLAAFELRGNESASHRASGNGRLSIARVNKLSGGEYQRVVLARAIAHHPRLVFVDEPTAALNRELARRALWQLKQSQIDIGGQSAVVMITHDEPLAEQFADQIIRMAPEAGRAAGRVVEVTSNIPSVGHP